MKKTITKLLALALAASACAMMAVTGRWNAAFLPALVLGGLLGGLAPAGVAAPRTGELGLAQVRLELTAGVLTQAEQLLLEAPEPVIDLQALVTRAANQACLSCPCRRSCGETAAFASSNSASSSGSSVFKKRWA